MQKIIFIWLSVLTILLLYLLVSNSSKKNGIKMEFEKAASDSSLQGEILFINTDSVISQYALAEEKRKFLEQKNLNRERQLRGKQGQYEAELKKYQKEQPILTQREQAKAEEKLMKLQNEILELQQQFQQEALAEEQALVLMLADTLESFMLEYAQGKNIKYVLGYQRDGSIFYKNPRLNITGEVIEALNQRYKP